MDKTTILGQSIRRRRVALNMSQSKLGRLIEADGSYVGLIERGILYNPTLSTLTKLANALQCGIDDLVSSEQSEE